MSKGITLFAVALVSAAVGAGAYHLYIAKVAGKLAGMPSLEAGAEAGPDTSAVVVTVNGTPITQNQIDRRIEVVGERAGEMFAQLPDAEKQRVIKENLILESLVDQQMKNSGIESDPAIMTQLAEARQQVLRTAYLDKVADGVVTDDMLRGLYDAQIGKLPDETEIHARHILVKDEALAKEIIAKLKAGVKFEELAKQYSEDKGNADQGGDLGFFTKAQMVPEFANAAFAMKAGEVSATPIKTGFGYHVVEVLESRVKAKPTFEEVKPALESQERNRVIKETIEKWRAEAKLEGDVAAAPAPAAESAPAEAAPAETPAPSEEAAAPVEEAPAPAAEAPAAEEAAPAPSPEAEAPTPVAPVAETAPADTAEAPAATEEVAPAPVPASSPATDEVAQ